jgi:putative PIN family toxin of toxin-antitoxin system
MFDVVLNTNVVISAHLQGRGLSAFIFDLSLARKLHLCVSEDVLDEYEIILSRPRFRFTALQAAQSLLFVRQNSRLVSPSKRLRICSDPDDDIFSECADAARAHSN